MQLETISAICVCGAGTMGSGIAQVAAMAGYKTIQFDVNEQMLARSKAGIETSLQKLADKGKISVEESTAALSRLRFTTRLEDCTAGLIIEAIIEDENAKVNLFNSLAAINDTDTIFASNTSSISISAIARQVAHAERLVGMHFFNPAPLMKLVEIITTADTDPGVVKIVTAIAGAMQKVPVICKDSPGFIVNRVARHYYLEAMKLVELGLANIEAVDNVMEAAGFKMGPFRLMDLIGLDINYSVSNIVWEAMGKPERLRPSPLQKAKVEAGELGKKSGRGWLIG
jgi:3-hydroxybutyryl-CoA dehydrogenase